MPAYSFKERFVPTVLDGSKTQTIRARRKKGFAKKGDRLYLYFGLRTKWCRKLKEVECKDVRTVVIGRTGDIFIWDRRLTDQEVEVLTDINIPIPENYHRLFADEADAFAWADGFRPEGSTKENPVGAYDLMIRWWKQTHELPFVGDVIYW